jgi:hypothetical protein
MHFFSTDCIYDWNSKLIYCDSRFFTVGSGWRVLVRADACDDGPRFCVFDNLALLYIKLDILRTEPELEVLYDYYRLQRLGLLVCPDPRFIRTGPSISSMVGLSLFFLLGGDLSASDEFGQLAFLRYIYNNFFFRRSNIFSSCLISSLLLWSILR